MAFTLFATHYFELTVYQDSIPTILTCILSAVEHNDEFVYCTRYSKAQRVRVMVQVAKLAGVPKPVIRPRRKTQIG